MSEALIIQTLTQKRAGILGQIKAYEAQIAHAKHNLAPLNANVDLLATPERPRARYMVSHGFFKKGDVADICAQHLGVDGEMTTREFAERVMAERGLEISDITLRNSVVFKIVQAPRHARRQKLVRMARKRKGAPGAILSLAKSKPWVSVRQDQHGPSVGWQAPKPIAFQQPP